MEEVMGILLEYEDGRLIVEGIPSGHRVLIGKGCSDGRILEEDILYNDRPGVGVEVGLPDGQFIFRARNKYGENYEAKTVTWVLPIEVLGVDRWRSLEGKK